MGLFQQLIEGDQWLFQLINGEWTNPFFDAVLPLCRERWFWAPLYLFVCTFSVVNFGKRGWLMILGLIITVGITDFTSSTIIKKNMQRVRPCNDVEMSDHVRKLVPCGGGYSFPSSHAANHFAVALFLTGIFGLSGNRYKKALLAWAGLIAYSQVYVGVHYPLDVITGTLLGCLTGWLCSRMFLRWTADGGRLTA